MAKYHQGAATWVIFEGEACQFIKRGEGSKAGMLCLKVAGWPTWVQADRCYPA